MLRIYGDENLPAVERVCLFLEEKSLEFSVSTEAPLNDRFEQAVADDILDGGPILIGDDQTVIAGVTPVCRYLEQLYPSPPMLGSTALEQAHVEMWQRYVENKILSPLGVYFFHGKCADEFPDHERLTNSEWAQENKSVLLESYRSVDSRLSGNEYLCGATFTIVDITLFSSVRFGQLIDINIPDEYHNLSRWQCDLTSRFADPCRSFDEAVPAYAVMH